MTAYTRAAATGTSNGPSTSVTIAPAIGDLFVVFASSVSTGEPDWRCTDSAGGTYTPVAETSWNDPVMLIGRGVCFVRNSRLPNTASTEVTITQANYGGLVVASVLAIAGVGRAGVDAVRGCGRQDSQTSGAPTVVMNNPALATGITLGYVGTADEAGHSVPPPANWTKEAEHFGTAFSRIGCTTVSRAGSFTSETVVWGPTEPGVAFGAIAVELDVAATSIPTTPARLTITGGRLCVAYHRGHTTLDVAAAAVAVGMEVVSLHRTRRLAPAVLTMTPGDLVVGRREGKTLTIANLVTTVTVSARLARGLSAPLPAVTVGTPAVSITTTAYVEFHRPLYVSRGGDAVRNYLRG